MNTIGEVMNSRIRWNRVEDAYPDCDREVYALIEHDTYHLDDEPYIDLLVLRAFDKPEMGATVYWERADARPDEEEVLTQDRTVVAWRYSRLNILAGS